MLNNETNNETIVNRLLSTGIVTKNIYLEQYVELMINNLSTPRQKYITQKHHIIPKYWYRYENIPVDNSKDNTVNLTFSDHILAHYYLALCASNDENKLANIRTLEIFGIFSISESIADLKEKFPQLNVLYSESKRLRTGRKLSQKTKDKISLAKKGHPSWNKGKKLSEETKYKISKANKGRTKTDEQKRKISETLKGRNKGIKKPELSAKLKGRVFTPEWKQKISNSNKGRVVSQETRDKQRQTLLSKKYHWYNNGFENRYLSEDNVPEGFIRGRKTFGKKYNYGKKNN